jgi:hypothetical protein
MRHLDRAVAHSQEAGVDEHAEDGSHVRSAARLELGERHATTHGRVDIARSEPKHDRPGEVALGGHEPLVDALGEPRNGNPDASGAAIALIAQGPVLAVAPELEQSRREEAAAPPARPARRRRARRRVAVRP